MTIYGDYGVMEPKAFLGVVLVHLKNIDLSEVVTSWYRLYPFASLVDGNSLGSTGSMSSIDSEAVSSVN